MVYGVAAAWCTGCGCMVYGVAAAWCAVLRLHSVQCWGCMVYGVAAAWCTVFRLHGARCCGCIVYGVAAAWCTVLRLHGLRYCGCMVCSLCHTFYLYPDGSCFHSAEAALLFLLLWLMLVPALLPLAVFAHLETLVVRNS